MLTTTPEEQEAIRLVWQKEGHGDSPIPKEEAARILAEIRQRVAIIESEAVKMGYQAVREGRHSPRRHQRFALVVLTVALSVIGIYYFLFRM